MKKYISALVMSTMLLSGCGRSLTYENKEYSTYGLANESTHRSSKLCYEVSLGNIIWSIFLIETIVAPVYFIGWSIWNPVKPKNSNGTCEEN